jgi:hypothetical protein
MTEERFNEIEEIVTQEQHTFTREVNAAICELIREVRRLRGFGVAWVEVS